MKATLRYKYVRFPQIRLKLKKAPIGTIARRYTRPVILTVFRPSRRVVVRASIWVMSVAKARCHVVSMMARYHIRDSRSHEPELDATYESLRHRLAFCSSKGPHITY